MSLPHHRQHQLGSVVLVYLLAAAAALAMLAGLYALVDGRGYARGRHETEAAYARRDNQALRDAITAKEAAEKRSRAIEDQRSTDAAEAAKRYQEGLADGKKELEGRLAALRAGTLRLRIPGSAGCPPDRAAGPVPAPGTGGRGGDGQAGAELPQPTADALLRLAGEADDVARQLAACQAVIEADRR